MLDLTEFFGFGLKSESVDGFSVKSESAAGFSVKYKTRISQKICKDSDRTKLQLKVVKK